MPEKKVCVLIEEGYQKGREEGRAEAEQIITELKKENERLRKHLAMQIKHM